MIKSARLATILPLVLLLAAGACKDNEQEDTSPTPQALLMAPATGWQLDETKLNGQVTGVKDRYVYPFIQGGAYHQNMMSNSDMCQGAWQLANQNATLNMVDHKGTPHTYAIQQLDAKVLKLQWSETSGEVHQKTYSAQ